MRGRKTRARHDQGVNINGRATRECPLAITVYFHTYKDRQACVVKCQRQRKIDKENGYDW